MVSNILDLFGIVKWIEKVVNNAEQKGAKLIIKFETEADAKQAMDYIRMFKPEFAVK